MGSPRIATSHTHQEAIAPVWRLVRPISIVTCDRTSRGTPP
ncbi:hypothetical protein [Laspinema sp. D2d]|nr:hypothetical protein [Laspinema sp. D2d]